MSCKFINSREVKERATPLTASLPDKGRINSLKPEIYGPGIWGIINVLRYHFSYFKKTWTFGHQKIW